MLTTYISLTISIQQPLQCYGQWPTAHPPVRLSDQITQHHTLVIILQQNFNSKTKSYLIATSAENLRQVFALRAWSMFYWDMEEKRVKDLEQSPAPFLLRHVTKIWKCGDSWSRPAAAAPQLRVTDCWSVTRRRGAGAGWRPSAARLPGSRAAADCDSARHPRPVPALTHILMWQLCCSRVIHHHQWSLHSELAADSLWRTLPPWSSPESSHSSCILLHWILRLWPRFLQFLHFHVCHGAGATVKLRFMPAAANCRPAQLLPGYVMTNSNEPHYLPPTGSDQGRFMRSITSQDYGNNSLTL